MEIETKITRFDGGMVNNPRDARKNTCRVVTGFDILTNSNAMTPYRESESGHTNASTSKPQNFAVALRTDTTYSLYSLGVISGDNKAEVFYKNLTTDSSNDLSDNGWVSNQTNRQGGEETDFELFVYYAKTGFIYGASTASNHIWAFDPADATAWEDDQITADGGTPPAMTNVAQGVVHSKDDILYIPYDNKIMKNDNGSWTIPALTLPAHLKINTVCERGNYLAIGCQDLSGVGQSRVFLWDRDSTLTTVSESIDWGEGNLKILEEVDGELLGISKVGDNDVRHSDRVVFKILFGSRVVKIQEFVALLDIPVLILPLAKQKTNNRLYFMLHLYPNSGTTLDGVWSIGRTTVGGEWSVIHERTPNNDNELTTAYDLYNFIFVGDFLFQSYKTGGVYSCSKTSDDSNPTGFQTNAIYESSIFDAGDASLKKSLIGVTVYCNSPQTSELVKLEYRFPEGSWVTIFADKASAQTLSAVNIESSGASFPKAYKEIQFRIISTGGAEIIGLSFKEEITGQDRPY